MTQINVPLKDKASRERDLQADGDMSALKNATPQQINNYIENNVTDLASAKKVLKLMARLLVAMWRKQQ